MTGHISEFVSGYIDGTLPPKTMEKVKAHLFFCNHCRNTIKEMQENVQNLKNLPPIEPPKGLEEKIILALEQEMQNTKTKKIDSFETIKAWFFSYKGLALAATAAVVLVILKPEFHNLSKGKVPPREADKFEVMRKDKLAENSASMEKSVGTLKQEPPVVLGQAVESKKDQPTAPARQNELTQNAMGAGVSGVSSDAKVFSEKTMRAQNIPSARKMSREWVEIKGDSSGVTEPFQEVISDSHSWQRIWNRHVSTQEPKPPFPPVNFDTNEVLFICAGSKPTGGFSLEIVSVENTDWDGKPARVVTYKIKTPPENSMNITVITQPFIFRLVPKITGPTFFKTAQ
ncbi:MAG: protease complex subunit PrcB family protein [Elusimicrobia bacterium]|nr:protease complex subunit PrcB family protein [Candidatus Obscuribacterium magneticum]